MSLAAEGDAEGDAEVLSITSTTHTKSTVNNFAKFQIVSSELEQLLEKRKRFAFDVLRYSGRVEEEEGSGADE